ncbi:hypothetical protein BXY70_0848 [Roseovarius halotolerans]|uniref:17 kDa surface antigen n=1 Tax=Roseovarius halotolerans TaxID=505353 RepID=A0A1X6YDX2_9RHOB|nr:glucose-6-phosphate isomerase [Roseovarius halotolerans]RKT34824.1 hypothetical protein BXY70_0848 [Roseovarius halotolerans]SLN18301.1 hypothetical protein ROH8110_00549 [Roseovarius halotolerans]
MQKTLIATAFAASLALTGCMTAEQERQAAGAAIGGSLGLITAKALGANDNWTVVSTLAGAGAGVLVARNRNNNTCAYSRGDGTYYRAACP